MRSYRAEELFDVHGRLNADLAELAPTGERQHERQSAREWWSAAARPDSCRFSGNTGSRSNSPGTGGIGDCHVLGRYLRDVVRA